MSLTRSPHRTAPRGEGARSQETEDQQGELSIRKQEMLKL